MDYRHIERFNRIAVERELSAGAILLWQQLYCMMQRKNNFSDVKICTAVLLGFLDLTRNGFQKARKALVEAGVLGIRYEGEDIYYTLELVHFAHDEKAAADIAVDSANTVGRHDHMPPVGATRQFHQPRRGAYQAPANLCRTNNQSETGGTRPEVRRAYPPLQRNNTSLSVW